MTHLLISLWERNQETDKRAHVVDSIHRMDIYFKRGWRQQLEGHAPPFAKVQRWVSVAVCGYGDRYCKDYARAEVKAEDELDAPLPPA